MEPEDDGYTGVAPNPFISMRIPLGYPPCTPAQAEQALVSASFDSAHQFLDHPPNAASQGLAAQLLGLDQAPPPHTLAGQLLAQGITSLPDCDPRLINVTTHPDTPTFQTAKGTLIQMNKPAPATTLPWGTGIDRLVSVADNLGVPKPIFSGGTEPSGHSTDSEHYDNNALDISGMNKQYGLTDDMVRQAAVAAGFPYGFFEANKNHWHIQTTANNVKDADLYDLRHWPMKSVYTPSMPKQVGGGKQN